MSYKNRKVSDLVKMTTRAIVRAYNGGLTIDPHNYGINPNDEDDIIELNDSCVCAVGALGLGRKVVESSDAIFVIDYVADSLNEHRDLTYGLSDGFMSPKLQVSDYQSPQYQKGLKVAKAVHSNLKKLGIPVLGSRYK